jgi:phosphoribosylanthranilate isomerase
LVQVKICGLRTVADVEHAAHAGAAYVGFVFFPKSPRHLAFDQAKLLAQATPVGVMKVALTVNATDAFLDQLIVQVPLDMLQLHGSETTERVAQVKARCGLPVMKALGVAGPKDLDKIDAYAAVADQLLIDAKPPQDGVLPGGNGLAFDWRLIAGRRWTVPWMLAGGLTPATVPMALQMTGAQQLDLSSGVESAVGVKDAGKISAFLGAAQSHPSGAN